MENNFQILMVEDDAAVGRSLRKGLEREGYEVTWKQLGEEGFAYAKNKSPHLVILDVRLPDISGFDVCRKMRQEGLHQPVMMLTAQGDEIDRILGIEIGADDYMTKPFSLRELQTRVRAHLRRAYGEFAAGSSQQLFIGDITIDLGRSEVKRKDALIDLTPTEFKMLVYLAQNKGLALSRQQIIEKVWGYNYEAANTVNVYIRRLREKIEPDPSQPELILTVPGIGYRLAG